MPLTDLECRKATAEGKSVRKIPDGAGLYLFVQADGKKYWRYRYSREGKEQLLGLGPYPAISLADARVARDKLTSQRAHGLDPSHERKAAAAAKKIETTATLEVLARDYVSVLGARWTEEHRARTLRRLEINIFPKLGSIPAGKITSNMMLGVIREIEARGATDLSHRVLSLCSSILKFGIPTGRAVHDVAADIAGQLLPHEAESQLAVSPAELPELMRAVHSYDAIGEHTTTLALRLLILTFVRTGEMRGATWKEIDWKAKYWAIPAARMRKNKLEFLVPLSRQALEILEEMRDMQAGPYIFPGRNFRKPMSGNTMLYGLYRLGYKGKMTGHGARAVASTVLNECGLWRKDVIERQLAHVEGNKVRAAYNRAEYLPERQKLMQWWADYLDEIVREGDTSGADA